MRQRLDHVAMASIFRDFAALEEWYLLLPGLRGVIPRDSRAIDPTADEATPELVGWAPSSNT